MIATYNPTTGSLEIFDKLDADGGWVIRRPDGSAYWLVEEFPEFGGKPQLIGSYSNFGDAYVRAQRLT